MQNINHPIFFTFQHPKKKNNFGNFNYSNYSFFTQLIQNKIKLKYTK